MGHNGTMVPATVDMRSHETSWTLVGSHWTTLEVLFSNYSTHFSFNVLFFLNILAEKFQIESEKPFFHNYNNNYITSIPEDMIY